MERNFYLLDNPNTHADPAVKAHAYPARRKPISLIVIHTAEALDKKLSDGDQTAERVAKYLSGTNRKASAHCVVDSDSIVRLLPDQFVAWHVKGYNSQSLGLEIAYMHDRWGKEPDREEAMLRNAGQVCREWAEIYGIPPMKLSKEQVDYGLKGFVAHSDLDPRRRKDPGPDFPWDKLFGAMISQ